MADRSYGAFGGREKAIAQVLFPFEPFSFGTMTLTDAYLHHPHRILRGFCSTARVVIGDHDVNPFTPCIYLEKHALWVAENRLSDVLRYWPEEITKLAQRPAERVASKDPAELKGITDPDSEPYRLWKRLHDRYSEGRMPKFLQQFWKG